MVGMVLPVSPASAAAAGCTPSVSLVQPYTDAGDVTHFVFDYQTCGPEMALKLKWRYYHDGRYDTAISGPVSGSGRVQYTNGPSCGGQNPPPKAQYLATLKIGPVLYAKSTPKTYTIPYRACP
jgi:hypothetical protein